EPAGGSSTKRSFRPRGETRGAFRFLHLSRGSLPRMSWFDLAGLLVFALAVFDGARSGFAWAALELGLLLVVAVLTRGLAGEVEPYVGKVADLDPDDLRGASHVVVFALAA